MLRIPDDWFDLPRQHRLIQRESRVGWVEMQFENHGPHPTPTHAPSTTVKININIVLRGSGTFTDHHGHTFALSPGTLFMRIPDKMQRSHYNNHSDYAECHISIDRFTSAELLQAGLFNADQVCNPKPLHKTDLAKIRTCYDALGSQTHARPTGSLLLQVLQLIDYWQANTTTKTPTSLEAQNVARACQLITKQSLTTVSIAYIASVLNMSDVQLRRAFARQLGMSPRAWFSRYRFGRACDMLSDMSVSEVAEQLGFCDPYSFSTQFKKHMGVSPSHYRA